MRGEQRVPFTSILARLYTWNLVTQLDFYPHLSSHPQHCILPWIPERCGRQSAGLEGHTSYLKNRWQAQYSQELSQIQPGSIPGLVLFTFFSNDLEKLHSPQVCRCCQLEGVRQKSSRSGLAYRGTWTGWWIRTAGTW